MNVNSNIADNFINSFENYDPDFNSENKKINEFTSEFKSKTESEKREITNRIYSSVIEEIKSNKVDCNLEGSFYKCLNRGSMGMPVKTGRGQIRDNRIFFYYYLTKHKLLENVIYVSSPAKLNDVLLNLMREKKSLKFGIMTTFTKNTHCVPIYIEYDGASDWKILISDATRPTNQYWTTQVEDRIRYFFEDKKYTVNIYTSNLIRQANEVDCSVFSTTDLKYLFKEENLFSEIEQSNPKLVRKCKGVSVYEIDYLPVKCLKMAQVSSEIKKYFLQFPSQAEAKVDKYGNNLNEYIKKWKRTRLIRADNGFSNEYNINIKSKLKYLNFEKHFVSFLCQPNGKEIIGDDFFNERTLGSIIIDFIKEKNEINKSNLGSVRGSLNA